MCDQSLSSLIELAIDGVGLFELLSIKTVTDLLPYVDLVISGKHAGFPRGDSESDPSLNFALQSDSAVADFLASRLERVRQAQMQVLHSTDPSIVREVAAISTGTHSRYRLLARPDAAKAQMPSFP